MILPRGLLRRCGEAPADQTVFMDGHRRRSGGDVDRCADRFVVTCKITKATLCDGLCIDPSQLLWPVT